MAWVERLRTVAIERGGPVITAVVLGLISIPVVAVSVFAQPPADDYMSTGWRPMETGSALLLAACAVIPASIAGGRLGGQFAHTRPATAVLLALASSWPIAIGLLPLAANVLGIRMVAAIVCIDACTAELTSIDPFSGAAAYVTSVIVGGSIGGVGLIAGFAGAVGWWLTRRRRASGRIRDVVVVYAGLHFWTVLYGAVPFVCLVAGTLAWITWLRWRGPRGESVEAAVRARLASSRARRSRASIAPPR